MDIAIKGAGAQGKDILVDVQYSTNFEYYGDIRIDTLSVFFVKEPYRDKSFAQLAGMMANDARERQANGESAGPRDLEAVLDKYITIKKPGKYFLKSGQARPDYVIFTLYNKNMAKDQPPDTLAILESNKVKSHLIHHGFTLLSRNKLKLNNKQETGQGDSHGSAFFVISLEELIKLGIAHGIGQEDLQNEGCLKSFLVGVFGEPPSPEVSLPEDHSLDGAGIEL